VLWRAILKAEWSAAVAWRQAFLDFEKPNRVLSRDVVEDFLGEIASPKNLMGLLEALKQEKMLIRHDTHRLEERILRHVAKDGTWKHQRGRRQPA
jgi:hypothetical protein